MYHPEIRLKVYLGIFVRVHNDERIVGTLSSKEQLIEEQRRDPEASSFERLRMRRERPFMRPPGRLQLC
ncbi:hypothetical protein TNCV_1215391 [Trichonephila clavipes]|nr:hypothetical protein TNCV_1215391 [Trichonephila clavipes]